MIVKIQVTRDDGTVIVQMSSSAFDVMTWQAMPDGELVELPDKALFGFSYVPCYIAPDGAHSLDVVEKVIPIEEIDLKREVQL